MTELKNKIVLITSPSLELSRNVSGVASVVRGIVNCAGVAASPLKWRIKTVNIGKPDSRSRGLTWALAQIAVPLKFAAVILSSRPMVIHINGPLNCFAIIRDALLLQIARLYTSRVIYHIHGGSYIYAAPKWALHALFIRKMLHVPALILTLSDREAESLIKLYGVCPRRIRVIPNAVMVPHSLTDRGSDAPLKILSIGRLSPEKGLHVLCSAFEECPELVNIIQLKMYGAGPLKDEIVGRLANMLGPAFHFGGVISGIGKSEIYNWADVVVMPSIEGEGLPMVLLEAMAAGVVPIATDDGSITDVLQDGKTGLLIGKGMASELAVALVNASDLKRTGKLSNLSVAARRLVSGAYDLPGYCSRLNSIYAELD